MLNAITNTAYGGQVPLTALALAAMQRNSAACLAPLSGYTFSDVAGTTAATIDGVVGCVVDSAIPLGSDVLGGYGSFDTDTGWTKDAGWSISGGTANFSGSAGFIYRSAVQSNKSYLVEFDLSGTGSGSIRLGAGGVSAFSFNNSPGRKSFYAVSDGNYVLVRGESGTFSTDNLVVKEVALIATNATAGQKPIWRKGTVVDNVSDGIGPYWLDSDLVDDKLITVAGAAYSAATVIKSIKGVGHITAHAQDISASTNWTDDNLCGLILSPAQPGAADLALMERYADYLAGVTP